MNNNMTWDVIRVTIIQMPLVNAHHKKHLLKTKQKKNEKSEGLPRPYSVNRSFDIRFGYFFNIYVIAR